MKCLKIIWQFCSYLFWPQWGKHKVDFDGTIEEKTMKRKAIIIGNSRGLNATPMDMLRFSKFLTSLQGGAWEKEEIVECKDKSADEILKVIDAIKAEDNDYVIVFNFRTKAKCFAGDVGSIGIALILIFCVGRLMMVTGDIAWIVLILIYGVDGCLTICHRIMLHENLGQAHRKHAYQLMANELKIPHVVVSTIYMVLQLVVSLVAIYVIPDTMVAHWCYLVVAAVVMAIAYIAFMMKYYHLHEEYLSSIQNS